MKLIIHPHIRVLFFLSGIIGTVLSTSNFHLLVFWIAFLLPLIILTGNLKVHFKFLLVVILPMSAMLSFLFWVILHNTIDNFGSVLQTILKLIIYTTVFQVTLLIPANQLYSTFKMWGLKGSTLITTLGSYIVWVDIVNRSDKILTARFARGFIAKRTLITNLKQLPYLLIPLIIGIIRTATERSESWDQKKMLYRIEVMKPQRIQYNSYLNICILIPSTIWLVINAFLSWM
jgi:hypothetical protein